MAYPKEGESTFTAKNGKKIVFRPEKSSDTEMLWAMFSTLSDESLSYLIPPFNRERIESWTKNIDYEKGLAIVAVIKEKNKERIIASASLQFNPQEALQHKAELGITVHDNYQNLGIGTVLLNHMLNIARKKQLRKISLIVDIDNTRAIHLYTKTGFTIEGKLRQDIYIKGDYKDTYKMAILL